MNYNFSKGRVGSYRSWPIEVIKVEDYEDRKFIPKSTVVYAVSVGKNDNLILVLKETVIGYMTPEGSISLEQDDNKPYQRLKKVKEEEAIGEEGVKETSIDDLFAMSAAIDKFLKDAMAKEW